MGGFEQFKKKADEKFQNSDALRSFGLWPVWKHFSF